MSTSNVNVVAHPLVQHKLSLMREKDRSTKSFREILNEIGMLLGYEVTRDLPLELVEIETCWSGPARSTSGATTTATSCRGWATPATGCSAPSRQVRAVGLVRLP